MKHFLLAVVGLSPQVVTETLYGLHQEGRKVDEVHLVTTREGRERVFSSLLAGKDGVFRKYLMDYGIKPASVLFNETTVHTVKNENGNPIPDLLDEEDSERFLDLCLSLAFELTKDPDTAVYFSVAGGRKTMSSCLALAAQAYGRPQDRVYHVLVSPEFEGCRDFFYPPPEPRMLVLTGQDGQPFHKSTKYAKVRLVAMPFVSIRRWLASDFLERPHDPATLMASLVVDGEKILVVDLAECRLRYSGLEVDLTPTQAALYGLFSLQKKNCRLEGPCRECSECYLALEDVFEKQEDLTMLYSRVCGSRPLDEMSDTGILNLSQENFNSYKSKIRRRIRNGLGGQALGLLDIASTGNRPARYGLGIEKNRLRVVM